MSYGDEIQLFGVDWALLHFVENNGMAFGFSLGGDYGKLALSVFRLIAVSFLIYYIRLLVKEKASIGLLASFGFILAGALGNIIDSVFYGLIFSESLYHGAPAVLFPPEGGYGTILHGKVVDMLYFPMFQGTFPSWFPFWANEPFLFFRPVFNIADASITVGVFSILLFHRSFFEHNGREKPSEDNSTPVVATSTVESLDPGSEMANEKAENLTKDISSDDTDSLLEQQTDK